MSKLTDLLESRGIEIRHSEEVRGLWYWHCYHWPSGAKGANHKDRDDAIAEVLDVFFKMKTIDELAELR